MTRKKVLFVSHNHPALLVGGVELYLQDVYATLERSDTFEPMLVARAGPPLTSADAPHPDSPVALAKRDPNQYLVYTDFSDFDYFHGRLSETKAVLTRSFRDLLLALEPDIVHFQHTVYLGYDLVRVTRNALPDTPIVYSLHDYLPICNHDGVMVRTMDRVLCEEESPRRCNECFPDVSPQRFFARKRFIQSHLALVDRFTTPSDSVRRCYVAWGLPEGKIVTHPYAVAPVSPVATPARAVRNRFGYFGQLNPYKGVDVLLGAMEILDGEVDVHLWIHGANLEKQTEPWRGHLEGLLAVERSNVTFGGPYDRGALDALMAAVDWVVVPSIWRETGPIVVLEAFRHGRPVICSNIGGMSEKVANGINGLHFRRGDKKHLAEVMEHAVETPSLWDELHGGIPDSNGASLESNVEALIQIYNALLEDRLTPPPSPQDSEQPIRR